MCPHHQVWGGGGDDDAIFGLGKIFRCQKVILLPVSCVERMDVEKRVAEGMESMALILSSMCPQYNPGSIMTSIKSNYVLISLIWFLRLCEQSSATLAHASHCQQEAKLDRPIAAHVNICPGAIKEGKDGAANLVSTAF